MQRPRELGAHPHRLWREPPLEVRIHVALAERVERELDAQALRAQLERNDCKGWSLSADSMRRKVATASQRAGPRRRASTEQAHGGMVAPVQVLDDEHQRLARRLRVEHGTQLAQHALGRGARRVRGARGELRRGVGCQPGQAREPGGRALAQCRDPGIAVVAARQLGQRIEHRQKRLAAAGLLDALAARHRRARTARQQAKALDERRLAEPASPPTSTSDCSPAHAPSSAAASCASGSSRPTSRPADASAGARSASAAAAGAGTATIGATGAAATKR